MIPSYEGHGKETITKLFNTIMMRAGITLIITAAFSVSTMFYSISAGYPFFMIAFLQIVTFAGIYFKLGDLMECSACSPATHNRSAGVSSGDLICS